MPFITTLALLVFVAASAGAQHVHGGHQRLHEKRDLVITTVTDYVTTTVNVTTTIWIDPWATSSSSPSSSTNSSSVIVATPAVTTPTTFVTLTSSSQQPAEFHEETKSVVAPAPAQSSSSVFVPPSPPPPPPATPTPPPAPAFVPPPTSTTPVVVPAVTSPPPAAPPASGGGSGLPCTSGSPCSGDITFYDAGLGACGKNSDGLVSNVIALPFGLMGEKSNDNPYCGLTVTIMKNGKSAVATVVDKCMGCTGTSIDLSHHVWADLGVDENLGRTQATWYFN